MKHHTILILIGLLGVVGMGTFWLGNANAQTTGNPLVPYPGFQEIPKELQDDLIPVLDAGVNLRAAMEPLDNNNKNEALVGYTKNGHIFVLMRWDYFSLSSGVTIIGAATLGTTANVDDEILVFEWRPDEKDWALLDCSYVGAISIDLEDISDRDITMDQVIENHCNVWDEEAYFSYTEDVTDWDNIGTQSVRESLTNFKPTIESLYAGKFVAPEKVTIVSGTDDKPNENPTFQTTSDYDVQLRIGNVFVDWTNQNAKDWATTFYGHLPTADESYIGLNAAEVKGADPIYFLVRDLKTNDERFLVEMFRVQDVAMNNTHYPKIGILVFVRDDDQKKWVLPWETITATGVSTLTDAGTLKALPSPNMTQPFILTSGAHSIFTLQEKTNGTLTIDLRATYNSAVLNYYDTAGNDKPAKNTDYIIEMKMDFSKVNDLTKRSVYRFRFDEKTEEKILATKAYAGKTLEEMYEDAKITVDLQNAKTKEKISTYFVTSGNNGHVHPLPTGVKSAYLRTKSDVKISKGVYNLELHLDGYSTISKNIRIGFDELTFEDNGLDDKDVSEADIRILSLAPIEFIEDKCGDCLTIQACMVCMDHQLIQRYNK